ncbi:MAG TPA: pyridoxal-phosphate dependent enzyme [Kofleriaceae bacterium]|jgi:threonine dehydratase|nr:pyridoxal-phosphate dependent enzyme [Kofleriaceae bacterium]
MTSPESDPIRRAAGVIACEAIETPLLRNLDLDSKTGARVFLKLESLQRTGSFKFRAAYFRLTELTARERALGVVTYSSGNFGKALAAAGQLLGIAVTIVVPVDAPTGKVNGARDFGAKIVVSNHGAENRETAAARMAERVAASSNAVLLHPFEDELLLTGHAALVREFLAQIHSAGAVPDMIVVPCGGGGLAGGCCLALRGAAAVPRIVAVEPLGYEGMGLSIAAGERRRAPGGTTSLCDALQATQPGHLAFDAVLGGLTSTVTVSDAEVAAAVRYAAEYLKLVIEPSAAAALAALLERKVATTGRTIALIITGGNIDPTMFAQLTARERE